MGKTRCETTDRPWRSKLRRLHRLSAWRRDLRHGVSRRKAASRYHKVGRRETQAAVSDSAAAAAMEQKRSRAAATAACGAAVPPHVEQVQDTRSEAAEHRGASGKRARTSKTAVPLGDTSLPEQPSLAVPPPVAPAGHPPVLQAEEQLGSVQSSAQEEGRPSLALALGVVLGGKGMPLRCVGTRLQPQGSPPESPSSAVAAPPMGADAEIDRVLSAESPEELLGVGRAASEEEVMKAWKRLVLLLHPDKLQRLDGPLRKAGAEALHRVHAAKDEMRRRSQEACAEVPAAPRAEGPPRCLQSTQGARKFEFCWRIPETQNPKSPVEKYEVWGPRYFSEQGQPFDWVLLATLPPLQSAFVLVEEAPTQQDCMWAADRVLRPTLPIAVHAVNGKGPSEPLELELPWAAAFPWLKGTPSVLCVQCFRLNARRGRDGWTKCGGCGKGVPSECSVVLRCPDCHGELLWAGNSLGCSCCLRAFGQMYQQGPPPQTWGKQHTPHHARPPPHPPAPLRVGGRCGRGGGHGGRPW